MRRIGLGNYRTTFTTDDQHASLRMIYQGSINRENLPCRTSHQVLGLMTNQELSLFKARLQRLFTGFCGYPATEGRMKDCMARSQQGTINHNTE